MVIVGYTGSMKRVDGDRYRRGAHTVLELQYHFVWKTKYGYPMLRGDVGLRLRAIILEVCKQQGMSVVRGNVRANHVHVLVSAPSHLSVAKMAQYLKGKSSYLLQRDFPEIQKRYWGQHLWSRGYFCSTVGAVTEQTIKHYIENQSDDPSETFKVWDQTDSSDKGSPLG